MRQVAARAAEPKIASRAVPVPDFPTRVMDPENLDIPAFLRKR
jgi:hypothetical protein